MNRSPVGQSRLPTMTYTQRLLALARDRCVPATWYQLSKRTGIAEATLSRVVKHGGTLDNANAFQLAAFLGMSAVEVIIYIECDRPHSPRKRAFWENERQRINGLPALTPNQSSGTPHSSTDR